MRNLLLIAALATGTAIAGLAPAMAEEKTQATEEKAPAIDTTQTSSIGTSVSGEWLNLCVNQINSVICQGHATYSSKETGFEAPAAPSAPR